MVIRRFLASIGVLSSAAVVAGCYEDNCTFRDLCPALDGESESMPGTETGPDPDPEGSTTSGSDTTAPPKLNNKAPTGVDVDRTLPGSAFGAPEKHVCLRDGSTLEDDCGIFVSSSKGDDGALPAPPGRRTFGRSYAPIALRLIRPAPSICTPLRKATSSRPRPERSKRSARVTSDRVP